MDDADSYAAPIWQDSMIASDRIDQAGLANRG
jgi:hypothetical protein